MFRSPDQLSKRAVECLKWLAENKDDDDIITDGIEVWFGYNRTNWRVLLQLLECCFVSQGSPDHDHYHINGSGERFLQGLPPYCDQDGKYHNTVFEVMNTHAPSKTNT